MFFCRWRVDVQPYDLVKMAENNDNDLVSNVDQMHDQNGQVKALAVP